MIVIVLIAIVAIAVAVLVMKNPGTKKKEEKLVKKEEKVVDDSINMEPSTSSTIHFSDEFKSTEPVITKYDNHEVKTILMMKDDSTIWVCPYCETENRMSRNKCCVCYNAK